MFERSNLSATGDRRHAVGATGCSHTAWSPHRAESFASSREAHGSSVGLVARARSSGHVFLSRADHPGDQGRRYLGIRHLPAGRRGCRGCPRAWRVRPARVVPAGETGRRYDQVVADPLADTAGFNPAVPHIARVYDYLLGGKDNFAADRAVGDQIIASLPAAQIGVRAQRAVLARVVHYLVADAGVRQLLDIGSGLPTAQNVHQIAQRIDPAARVVYVDNDPVVLAHARALLADDSVTFAAKG